MALSASDQAALDSMLSEGFARFVLLERECRQLRTAVAALTTAQRTTLQGLGGGAVWAELQDMQTVLTAPLPVRLVIVAGARWLRRERIAEALQTFLRDHSEASALLDDLRARLIAAGGTPGEVEAAPINEDAV